MATKKKPAPAPKMLGVRLPGDMVEFVENEAATRRVTLSQVIRDAIMVAMKVEK